MPAKSLAIGARVAANYEVVKELGSGGYGTLFLAENRLLHGQRAVVKVLKGGKQGASAEEARVLATVEHPNVVHVYAHDTEYDCIVMQHLSGVTLHSLVGRLNPVTAVRVAQSVALALDAVHQKQLVHRDVKPENVLVEGKGGELGWVKLIDFGLALKIGKQNELAGTPEYCSPEQFVATSTVRPSSDIYSLGVMIFEMCSHRLPFMASTAEELGRLHSSAPVPGLLEVRHEMMNPKSPGGTVEVQGEVLDARVEVLLQRVDELARSMMAKQPEDRPDAKAVARRLDEIERDFSSESTQVGFRIPTEAVEVPQRTKTATIMLPSLDRLAEPTHSTQRTFQQIQWPQRNRRRLALAVAALLFLMLAGWWLFSSRGTENDSTATPAPVATVTTPPAPTPAPPVAEPAVSPEPTREPPPEADLNPTIESMVAKPAPAPLGDAGEELAALPKLPLTKKSVKAAYVVEPANCDPDENWKKNARADLNELTQRSAKHEDLLLWAADENDVISKAIAAANTRGDCSEVEERLRHFTQKVLGKGAEQ